MKSLVLFSLVIFSTVNLWSMPMDGIVDFQGKAADFKTEKNQELVVFWATWCSTCKAKLQKDLPELVKKGQVEVITVNVDEDVERARHEIDDLKVTLPVLRDPNKVLRKKLGVRVIPHWAVYRRENKTDWKLVASAPAFEWADVQKALSQK